MIKTSITKKTKYVVATALGIVLLILIVFLVDFFTSVDVYYLQVDNSQKWIIDKSKIEDKALTDLFHIKGIIYNGGDTFNIDSYHIHLYMKYTDPRLGEYNLIESNHTVYGGVITVHDGYNIGSVGYHSIESFHKEKLDTRKAYLLITYERNGSTITDTVVIDINDGSIGNNELDSVFINVKTPNIVSTISEVETDLFFLGATIDETLELLEDYDIYNTGLSELKDGSQLISVGRLSEIGLIYSEDGILGSISIMSEISTEHGIGFDASFKDVVAEYGYDYKEVDNNNGTRKIEYRIRDHYVSFTFTFDKLELWKISAEPSILD